MMIGGRQLYFASTNISNINISFIVIQCRIVTGSGCVSSFCRYPFFRMATRDLTQLFLKCRTDAQGGLRRPSSVRDPSHDLLDQAEAGGQSQWETAKMALPPLWVDTVEDIESDIRQMKKKMDDMAKLHATRLLVRFDDSQQEEDIEIETLAASITQLFRHAEGCLKRLASAAAGSSGAEQTVRNNIQRNLARRLQTLSQTFRNKQKEFMARLKAQKQGNDQFDFLSQNESKTQNVDMGFTDAQMMVVEEQNALADERDTEIEKIAASINELAVIFKELAVLVIDQGTVLDRIDYNMELVVERTEEGVKQLEKAEEHQKASRPLKCIIGQLVIIAVLVAIIIAKNS